MMPNITRGGGTAGLVRYLFGKGRSNEHKDQRIIAGDAGVELGFKGNEKKADFALDLANHLDAAMKMHGVSVTIPKKRWKPKLEDHVTIGDTPGHVWHCSLSLKVDDVKVSDEQWASIARDFVSKMGFEADDDADVAGCRWVAVHHGESKAGNDHVHIAVNLVREDGTKASVHNDFRRAQTVANELERTYGLRVLASREEGLVLPEGTKPAELDRSQVTGRAQERDELRRRLRSMAANVANESDFVEWGKAERVLMRPRYAKKDPADKKSQVRDRNKVEGYSVALVPTIEADGKRGPVIWFAPSKLDSNLGLGQLRAKWGSTADAESAALEKWAERSLAAKHGVTDVASRRRRPERLPTELVQRLNMHGQNVVPDRAAGFDRHAAIDLSIAFARASEYFEREEHGPFATASDAFARAGARDRPSVQDPDRARRSDSALGASAAYQARLMARAVGRNSPSGWMAVFRQMQRTGRALAVQSEISGRADQAKALSAAIERAVGAFEEVTSTQRAGVSAGPPPRATHSGKAPAQELGRE